MQRDVGALGRPLDVNAAERCVLELLLEKFANAVILLDVARESLRIGVPLRGPLFRDTEPNSDWMYFLTHNLLVGYPNGDVTVAFRDRVRPPLRAGPIAIEERGGVDHDRRDLELVDVGAVIVLGVRYRR